MKMNFLNVNRRLCSAVNSANLDKEITYYSSKRQTPVSLKSFMETGRGERLNQLISFKGDEGDFGLEQVLIQVACFLHRELPVRIAHRVQQLETSPLLRKSDHIRKVCEWYKTSFAQIRSCPIPDTPKKEQEFSDRLSSVYDRHSTTLMTLAKGVYEIRQSGLASSPKEEMVLQQSIDEFYLARIGIRMLVAQYQALRHPTDPDMIGLVALNASPHDIAEDAIAHASYVCSRNFGVSPDVTVYGRTDLTFPYIPSHISYMLVELLKNSMRATVETHGPDDLPPIKVVIADGEENEDVVIKVSDEGGGIRRSHITSIFSYLYTTANPDIMQRFLTSEDDVKDFENTTPLAGLGYGLPIARNYARYFGGDLVIMSMEGYGTDAYLYLPRLGTTDSSIV